MIGRHNGPIVTADPDRNLPRCPQCDGRVNVGGAPRVAEPHGRLTGQRIAGVSQSEPCPGSGQPVRPVKRRRSRTKPVLVPTRESEL